MKKSISSLGKVLNKVNQQNINGGGFINKCKNDGDFCDWISQSGYGTGTCGYMNGMLMCIPD
ncbi:hypothetical protein [Tenacibaculum sp.]|uniref:hypothetical protein n=1 Tax=Tenacibaculum sp. TaxID=1906242 RepID=UPI003D13F49D